MDQKKQLFLPIESFDKRNSKSGTVSEDAQRVSNLVDFNQFRREAELNESNEKIKEYLDCYKIFCE